MDRPQIEFDELRMYFGEPYLVDCQDAVGSITVYTPSIGDIINVGQTSFFETLSVFVTNPTQNRLPLWEAGIDWNTLTDFQLFCILYKTINPQISHLLFGDLDWDDFEICTKRFDDEEEGEMVLASREQHIEVNENVYNHIHQYLQTMFNIHPEDELTDGQMMKELWIHKDKVEREQKAKKKTKDEQSLKSLISACVNHPGFKYKLNELREVNVAEFYDSVARLQIYETSTACLKGLYSGFVDGSKIDPENYNIFKNM